MRLIWGGDTRVKASIGVVTVAVVVVAVGLAQGRAAASGGISRAALAPFVAYLQRNPIALCHAFTRKAQAGLARAVSSNRACVSRVSTAFRLAAAFEESGNGQFAPEVKVVRIVQRGRTAEAELTSPHVFPQRTIRLRLERGSGEWRVSTTPVLVLLDGCLPSRRCVKGREA